MSYNKIEISNITNLTTNDKTELEDTQNMMLATNKAFEDRSNLSTYVSSEQVFQECLKRLQAIYEDTTEAEEEKDRQRAYIYNILRTIRTGDESIQPDKINATAVKNYSNIAGALINKNKSNATAAPKKAERTFLKAIGSALWNHKFKIIGVALILLCCCPPVGLGILAIGAAIGGFFATAFAAAAVYQIVLGVIGGIAGLYLTAKVGKEIYRKHQANKAIEKEELKITEEALRTRSAQQQQAQESLRDFDTKLKDAATQKQEKQAYETDKSKLLMAEENLSELSEELTQAEKAYEIARKDYNAWQEKNIPTRSKLTLALAESSAEIEALKELIADNKKQEGILDEKDKPNQNRTAYQTLQEEKSNLETAISKIQKEQTDKKKYLKIIDLTGETLKEKVKEARDRYQPLKQAVTKSSNEIAASKQRIVAYEKKQTPPILTPLKNDAPSPKEGAGNTDLGSRSSRRS